jgi:hypothetical protein
MREIHMVIYQLAHTKSVLSNVLHFVISEEKFWVISQADGKVTLYVQKWGKDGLKDKKSKILGKESIEYSTSNMVTSHW